MSQERTAEEIEIRKAHGGHPICVGKPTGIVVCLKCNRIIYRRSVPVVTGCTEDSEQLRIDL